MGMTEGEGNNAQESDKVQICGIENGRRQAAGKEKTLVAGKRCASRQAPCKMQICQQLQSGLACEKKNVRR